jgi:nucleoporin p58/p45
LELELKSLKDEYRGIWREKTGRLVDPFRLTGGGPGVKGVESGVRGMEIR